MKANRRRDRSARPRQSLPNLSESKLGDILRTASTGPGPDCQEETDDAGDHGDGSRPSVFDWKRWPETDAFVDELIESSP